MTVTADEINFLIRRHLQEMGFIHTAYVFSNEALVDHSKLSVPNLPPQALITILKKGMLYMQMEKGINEKAKTDTSPENIIISITDSVRREEPIVPQRPNPPFNSSNRTHMTPPQPAITPLPKVNIEPRNQNIVSVNYNSSDKTTNNSNNNNNNNNNNNSNSNNSNNKRNNKSINDRHICEPMKIPKTSVLLLKGHFLDVYCGAWTSDGRFFATGSGDATAIIWEIQNHNYVRHYILDHSSTSASSVIASSSTSATNQQVCTGKDIAALAWNPAGTILATGCYDGTARLWTNRGVLKFVLSHHDQPAFAVQFSPDGKLLLTGGADNRIVVWCAETGERKQVFHFHESRALDVDWLDNCTFASCSGDSRIAIFTVGVVQPRAILEGHTGEVNKIEWDPSGNYLASCSDDKTVKIWKPFDKFTSPVINKCMPILSSSSSNRIGSFNNTTNNYISKSTSTNCVTLIGHTNHVYTIKWAPNDSKILASGAFDFTVRLWDTTNQSCVAVLSEHTQPIYTLCFSPKGKFLVSGGIDNVMNMWRTNDASLVASYQASGGIFEAQWDNSGQNIALCLSDANVAVISTKDILLFQE